MPSVVDYLDEFTDALRVQLESDEKRHGDTWLSFTRRGQEDRIFEQFDIYYEDHLSCWHHMWQTFFPTYYPSYQGIEASALSGYNPKLDVFSGLGVGEAS